MEKLEEHTASTRSKEDLPAFCRPIMVTSISVALQETESVISKASSAGTGRGGGVLDLPGAKTEHPPALNRPTYQNILKSQS